MDDGDRTDQKTRPRTPLISIREMDPPQTLPAHRANDDVPRIGGERLYDVIADIRHQWTAVLVFDGDHEEHHRFADEEDLRAFLRRNTRYRVKRTFQTVVHPRRSYPDDPGPPGGEDQDPDPVAA